MALVYRGKDSREYRNPILYGMARYWAALVQEWYYLLLQLSSNMGEWYVTALVLSSTACWLGWCWLALVIG
jgi:hypothetical protein